MRSDDNLDPLASLGGGRARALEEGLGGARYPGDGGGSVAGARAWVFDLPPHPCQPWGRPLAASDEERRHAPRKEPMKRRSPIDAGFDRWLDRQLHDIYDPVLSEAVPDEIERLLKEFDRKPAGDDDDEATTG